MREKLIMAVQIILICLGIVKTTWKRKPGLGYETCGVRKWNPLSWVFVPVTGFIVGVAAGIEVFVVTCERLWA